jgi:copper resistance protein B
MNFKQLSLAAMMAVAPLTTFAGGISDDPLLTMFKADKLEWRDVNEGTLMVWEIDAWIGKDLNKLWIKSKGESLDGTVDANEVDVLYSKAISPFWDIQMGLRHEFKPTLTQDWVGVGFMGVAPYLFEIDANVFVNQDSLVNARIAADYEYMFTQKVILIPNIELSLYSGDDNARGIVSGLSSAELGLRLHYAFKREFSPYIGINYEKKYGNSVVEASSGTQLLLGLSFWF